MENASDDFPQQKKLEDLLPNFAGSSPPILPKTSPTSLWKSLVFQSGVFSAFLRFSAVTAIHTHTHYGRVSKTPCLPAKDSRENSDLKSLCRSAFSTAVYFGQSSNAFTKEPKD